MIKYTIIFQLLLRCLLVARKENSTGFSTGLTGRSKNLDPTGNPTGRSTRPVSISESDVQRNPNCTVNSDFKICYVLETVPVVQKHNWNDRRSRRVFLCFYSAIFQLTSAKFQTFAYNSRTIGPSYMKFYSSLRLMSCMFVPNFEAIGHVTLVLEPENRPASLAKKAVSVKNG